MKNAAVCFLLATLSCVAQDVVKFSGKITNPNSDKITVKGDGFLKEIPVKKDGSFSASFAAPEAVYQFFDGVEYSKLYLKNGFDLMMTADAAQFDESIVYKGKGAAENNILAENALEMEKLQPQLEAAKTDSRAFSKIFRDYSTARNAKMTAPGIDPGLKIAYDVKSKADAAAQKEKMAAAKAAKTETIEKYTDKPAPDFNYENH